jgi:uncharacterized protein (UPF0332 family)
MAIEPHQILGVAKELKKNASSEAHVRSSVSRAYYAALTAANKICPKQTASIQQMQVGSHEKLIQALVTASGAHSEDIRLIGETLKALKPKRVRADYRLAECITESDASMSIRRAETVLGGVAAILAKRMKQDMETSAG